MKKCRKCNSISLDSENSCGVCGASLSDAASEDLEQLVHTRPKTGPMRKWHRGMLAVILASLASISTGASMLVLLSAIDIFFALGLILLFAGLVVMLVIAGGAGAPIGRRVKMREITRGEEQVRREKEERKRRTGEED